MALVEHASSKADEVAVPGLRQLACTARLLNRADGSARWAQGDTCVVAAVYGPRPVAGRKEDAEKATLEVIWGAKTGPPALPDKHPWGILMRRSLESFLLLSLHPSTLITIIIQVVHDDGSLLSCAINAASAALADAGVAMRGLLFSVNCAISRSGVIIADPTLKEEQAAEASVCLSFANTKLLVLDTNGNTMGTRDEAGEEREEEGVVASTTKGAMSVDDYFACVAIAQSGVVKLTSFFRMCVHHWQGVPIPLALPPPLEA
eukprot:TRINITY_DN32593_c0_g1_i1.p1 TRINITY_DN32593_c0_g1~~TRINITY_DN32593_c0_g1_i1.p1  ORF type:complete len:262 (+),score=47.39 TRINITY_DN32593_c0_g1_i1:547-1332(+)